MDIWHCLDINSTTFNALSPYRRTSVVILLLVLMLVVETPRLSWSDEAQDRSRELLAKGWQQFDKHVPAHYAMALRFFNQAKEAEPGSAEVDAALATLYWRGYEEFWFNVLRVGRSDARLQAKSYLEAALRSPTAVAHQVDCRMKAFRAKHDEALAACERAIALDPENAGARHAMALALIYNGEPEKALLQIQKARGIEPDMEDYHGYYEGMARFFTGDSEAAIRALKKAITANPELWSLEEEHFASAVCQPCILQIAALGDLGREDEANQMVEAFMKVHIDWTVTNEMYWWSLRRERDIERLANGLRLAGVPD